MIINHPIYHSPEKSKIVFDGFYYVLCFYQIFVKVAYGVFGCVVISKVRPMLVSGIGYGLILASIGWCQYRQTIGLTLEITTHPKTP